MPRTADLPTAEYSRRLGGWFLVGMGGLGLVILALRVPNVPIGVLIFATFLASVSVMLDEKGSRVLLAVLGTALVVTLFREFRKRPASDP